MVRTVLAILSIALLSACGLKGPLYMTDENGQRQQAPSQTQQQQPSACPPTVSCRIAGKTKSRTITKKLLGKYVYV